jgi:hypothetical protein
VTTIASTTASHSANDGTPTGDPRPDPQTDLRLRPGALVRGPSSNEALFATNAETQLIEADTDFYSTIMLRRGTPGDLIDARELFPELDDEAAE